LALDCPFTVDLTSTVSTACGGTETVHVVREMQLTVAASIVPNLKSVASPRARIRSR
jgi:hypothetical protein